MQLVDAVNIMLRSIRHNEVADVSDSNAKAAEAQDTLTAKRKEILVRGFPFNTDKVDLIAGTDDRVEVNTSYIKLELPTPARCNLSVRWDGSSRYLWDIEDNDWYDQDLNGVYVTSDITDFTQIPELVAQWITYEAALDLYAQNYPDATPPRHWAERAMRAKSNALNHFCNKSLDRATGWGDLKQVGTVSTPQVIAL